jgi:hypothetical protein
MPAAESQTRRPHPFFSSLLDCFSVAIKMSG